MTTLMPFLPFLPTLTSFLRRALRGLCLLAAAQAATAQPAPAQPFTLRVVGGLSGLNQYTRNEEPFWSTELARLSAGRFTGSIVPFDRAGVPSADMLRMIQLGVVPFGTILLSSLSSHYPQYSAPDLAGLNPDMATLQRNLNAFRPFLEHELRVKHHIEALAVYVYPAQVVFCRDPFRRLDDLSGRRIRVSSPTQSDFIAALGGEPVLSAFPQIISSMNSRLIDCAITGTMSGHTIGLHRVSTHIHAMAINWGLAVFGANQAAWNTLPPELKALLRQELPRLERAIWQESENETALGLACNTGAPACTQTREGRMMEVPVSPEDERRRHDILTTEVLPRWLRRCNSGCATIWNQTIGPLNGIMLPTAP